MEGRENFHSELLIHRECVADHQGHERPDRNQLKRRVLLKGKIRVHFDKKVLAAGRELLPIQFKRQGLVLWQNMLQKLQHDA